jgi:hypothetical protein
MALHEVQLKGYSVRPGNLSLGTFGSYGIEQLHVTLDDTWSGLAVTATFNPPKGEPREIRLPENGLIDVPAEATANEGTGTIVYCGVANGVQRITKTQGYNVITRGPVGGTEPFKPSESLATQVLQAALNAEKNSAEAKSVADNLRNDAANGKFDGKDGAKGDKGDTGDKGNTGAKGDKGDKGFSPTAAVTQLENGAEITITDEEGTTKATVKNGSKGDKGDRGSDGVSPTISVEDIENGHRVTIVDATGTTSVDIYNGEDGTDGKDGAQVDDSSIGDKPWSSKHIIDMLCPPLEESGNPVVCYPVAGYPLGVKASWEPMQEGSGTPSPENIRPIKGRDSVRVERCGENLIDSDRVTEVSAAYGLTAQYVSGKITISGIYSNQSADASFSFMSLSYKLPPTTKFMYSDLKTSGCTLRGIRFTNKGRDKIAIDLSGLTIGEKAEISFYLIAYVDTTAPTTYTPYIGQTNTLTLPETVYGGEVDAVTGEGQETQKLVILNGTESWNSWGINAHNPAITGFYTYDINDYDAKNAKGICSHLETPNQDVLGGRNAGIGFATVGSSRYFMFSMLTSSLPDISAGHEVDSLKAYLAAQNDAGTPVQIAYKLAEPVPFTATGGTALPALAGANTVLTDADTATVTGRADPIKRITDLEDAVASQT